MKLNDLKVMVDQLVVEGKGHYTLIDNTEGLVLPSKLVEGIVSEQETQFGSQLSFHSLEELEEDYQWNEKIKDEIIKNKQYDAVRLF